MIASNAKNKYTIRLKPENFFLMAFILNFLSQKSPCSPGLRNDPIGDNQQNHADDGLQQSDGRSVTPVSAIDKGKPVNISTDHICNRIHRCRIKIEYLIEGSAVHKTSHRQNQHYADGASNAWPGNIRYFLKAVCAIDLGCLIKLRIDSGQRRQIDDGIPTEVLRLPRSK